MGVCYLFIVFIFIYLYMKPTHKTVYTMDIKRHNVYCWLIGNCRDEPLTQRRKSYNRGKGKTQYKKRTYEVRCYKIRQNYYFRGILNVFCDTFHLIVVQLY